jgi:hypothetical protein
VKHLKAMAIVVVAALYAASAGAQQSYRYFLMSDGNSQNDFVFALNDPKLIEEARAIIHGPKPPRRHVSGIIDTSAAPYNPKWGFHYESSTISFPEISIEVCDAETSYVQNHLKDVGHHFLPGNRWCPWGQHVVKEIDTKQQ